MLTEGLSLPDIRLIAITHLHFDHAGGLMELAAGKPHKVPVYVSPANAQLLQKRDDINFLLNAGFMTFTTVDQAAQLGISLIGVPHDPRFPTDAIVLQGKNLRIWYSPDIAEITQNILLEMKRSDVVVIDSTFFDETVYPTSKYNHTIVVKTAKILSDAGISAVYSHINHSENIVHLEEYLLSYGHRLAYDGMRIK